MSEVWSKEALQRHIVELEAENADLRLRPKSASLTIESPPIELNPEDTGNYAFREFAPGVDRFVKIEIVSAEGHVWRVETKLAPDAVVSRYDERFAAATVTK